MAYVKTNWQDGVEGNTKIDATKLNNIEDGVEANDTRIEQLLVKNNIITVTLSSSQSITGTSETRIKLNRIVSQIGTSLSLNTTDNTIVVGSGISYILVSGQTICNTYTTNGLRRIIVRKNNEVYSRTMNYYTQNFNSTLVLSPILIPVSEGDAIAVSTMNAGNTTIYAELPDTFFTVEAVA